MYEFNVPEGLANLDTAGSQPAELLSLVIGILGDEAARIADLEMEGDVSIGRILPNEPFALRFAAAFLHAYVSSRYGEQLATELLLLSGAGYYLCDLAGSAGVLVREAALAGPPSTIGIRCFAGCSLQIGLLSRSCQYRTILPS